jgi:hypothetical protein
MQNHNNICINCYKTFKSAFICPDCGEHLIRIPCTYEVPKQSNAKAWKKFIKQVEVDNFTFGIMNFKDQVKQNL